MKRLFGAVSRHDDDDHEHDLGLAHDLQVMSRRRALGLFGLGAVGTAALVAGCSDSPDSSSSGSSASSAAGESGAGESDTGESGTGESAAEGCAEAAPQETAGPYPGDGSNGPNVLIASGILRKDIRSSFGESSGTAEGVPMTISLTVQDLEKSCAPAEGFALYAWHCDRDGHYSLYSEPVVDQNYLRGVQVADAQGKISFTSIFPACYSGRWPHIHFEVFESLESAVAGENARLTSQIALPEDVCREVYENAEGYSQSVKNLDGVTLDKDNVFGDGWTAELATVTGDLKNGFDVAITIGVAAKSKNVAAAPPGGMPPGGAPPGGMPPGGMSPSGFPAPPQP